jgi:predicted phage-related endonuclease
MQKVTGKSENRRQFLGGSDARIIMNSDEAALIRLWKEKRGEIEPEDLNENLIVQLGVATEPLNRTWYERNTGRSITDIQRWVQHPVRRFLAATLDGFVNDLDAVFEAKFMLPGRSRKRRLPKSTWPSSSTTCGSPTLGRRRSRSSPAAANGSN